MNFQKDERSADIVYVVRFTSQLFASHAQQLTSKLGHA